MLYFNGKLPIFWYLVDTITTKLNLKNNLVKLLKKHLFSRADLFYTDSKFCHTAKQFFLSSNNSTQSIAKLGAHLGIKVTSQTKINPALDKQEIRADARYILT